MWTWPTIAMKFFTNHSILYCINALCWQHDKLVVDWINNSWNGRSILVVRFPSDPFNYILLFCWSIITLSHTDNMWNCFRNAQNGYSPKKFKHQNFAKIIFSYSIRLLLLALTYLKKNYQVCTKKSYRYKLCFW